MTEKEKQIIDTHFYHKDKALEEKTKKYLLDNFQIEPECPSHEQAYEDFEDNHVGRRRDNRYDKEDVLIDEWYDQW